MSVAPYILLYLAAAVLAAALAIYGWQRRRYRGAKSFGFLMAAVAFWSAAHALSVAGPTFEGTLFWSQVQYGGIVLVGPLWVLFALVYAGRWSWATPARQLALLIPAALAYAAVLTNSQHYLWWTSVAIDAGRPFVSLRVERGPLFWLHIAYSYGCVLTGLWLFISAMLQAPAIYQRQARLVVIGALIPIVVNMAHLLGIRIQAIDDPTPFSFVAAGLVVFYASLRYHLLDLEPIAQREVFESMPDGVVVLDRRGLVVSINDPASQLLAIRRAGWVGRSLIDLADDSPLLAEARAILAPPYASLSRQVTYKGADGLRCVELRLRALFAGSGHHAGALLVLRDRTERMRMEQMLDRRLAELTLLNQITRAANAALQTGDLLRTIACEIARALPWDRVALGTLQPDGATLRWTIDQPPGAVPPLEGRSVTEGDFPAILRVIRAGHMLVLSAGDPLLAGTPTEAVLQRLDLRTVLVVPLANQSDPLGALLVGHCNNQPITPDEMRLFETVGTLISEAILRTRLYEEAQQANMLKSAFLASVSHELRTPLTSIIGFADMLRKGIFGPLPDSTAEPLSSMRHSSRTLLRLINDILDFSKLEAGHFSVDLHPVDLPVVVHAVLGTMQPQMHERGLALRLELDPDLPMVYANNERLEQVLTNLLSNAIKFTDDGAITVRAMGCGDHVRLSVQDTGIGIAREHQAELFQAFRQIENAHTRRFGGTGLGLAISRRLVELMGGALSLESAPGAGSTFHCDLCVAPVGVMKEKTASE